ncbi:MAG: protein kinase [Deltaproteobacteria bacterium]|nr:protein kinase [Deltaproteobacteria bacterium]
MTERTSPGDAPSPATTTDPLAQTQPNEESTDTGSSSSGARPLDREDPERIGRYRLVHRIGEGGMGLVYLAHDDQLDRPVAVKVLRPGGDGDPRRLLREARSMARLSHPHIAAVYDVGTHDGDVYVAMEFVEGVNLRQWHEQASRSWKARCDMLLQAARGLVAAHAVGVVHRDFKPDNVIVGNDGRVRVLDFGLAKLGPRTALRQQDTTETMLGSIAGTPRYMAPEQLRGKPVGPAADQFALCVTAYELAYDQRPFPGEVFADVAAAVLTRPPASPPESTDVPDAVWPLLRQGMQLAQDERHTDVAAFVALLEDIAGAEPIPAVVSLPALRDAREQARDQMTSAYADDLIDADELDHRLEDLEDATDLGTVAALIADLARCPSPLRWCPRPSSPRSSMVASRVLRLSSTSRRSPRPWRSSPAHVVVAAGSPPAKTASSRSSAAPRSTFGTSGCPPERSRSTCWGCSAAWSWSSRRVPGFGWSAPPCSARPSSRKAPLRPTPTAR